MSLAKLLLLRNEFVDGQLDGNRVQIFFEDDRVRRNSRERIATAAQFVPGREDEILKARVRKLS
jgi:hypothetical protein